MSFAARTVVDALPGPAAIVDEDGRVLVANDSWRRSGPAEGDTLAGWNPQCPAHGSLPGRVREARSGAEFRLPCRCTPATEIRVTGLESTCGALRRLVTIATTTAPTPAPAPAPVRPAPERPAEPPLPPGRVLLAEDDEVNRTVLQRMMALLGVQCDVTADGDAAVAALSGDTHYDLVLMDLNMPGNDGLTATRQLRAAGRKVPIVALTAAAAGEGDDCLAAGMNGYLTKPISLPELREALARYLTAPAPAPPPPPPADDVLSVAQLHELERELEGRELVMTTVSTFLAELDGRRGALANALTGGKHDQLGAVAHTLKSASALLGAQPLADACARVERLASAAADAGVLAAAVSEVDRLAAGTAIAMAGYLDEG